MPPTRDAAVAKGTFCDRSQAAAAISKLQASGFPATAMGWTQEVSAEFHEAEQSAAAGAVIGAATGTLWALGIVTGALPAVGPVMAGTFVALIAGAVLGAVVGGLFGMWIGLASLDSTSRRQLSALAPGNVIVTVRAGTRMAEATQILLAHGAANTRTPASTASPLQPAIS